MLVCAIPTDDIVRTISGKLFRRGRPAHVLHRGVQFGRVGKVLRRNPQQQTPVDAFLADVRQGTIDVIHTERLDRHGHQRRTAVANFRQERLDVHFLLTSFEYTTTENDTSGQRKDRRDQREHPELRSHF
uniref:(northern house mosquito) hypothetical protein n=1 Tax=Culex pipiens TaxID=7175 RepID=A0A8D8PDS3_CULPI